MNRRAYSIFWQLVSRSVRTDYLENLTGFAWLILQPLLLLAVYSFVFTTIFQARIPDAAGIGFVPYLAVAFWPWTAFADGVLKGSQTITANSALIGKVAFPSELLPLSTVTANFLMHLAGFMAVLLVLAASGVAIQWSGLPLVLVLLGFLWMLAAALALLTSALQVFVRDLAQMLPPLMTFWFFITPILYSPSLMPDRLQFLVRWNPLAWFVGRLREALLTGLTPLRLADFIVPVLTLCLLLFAAWFFRRLRGHFEDFL